MWHISILKWFPMRQHSQKCLNITHFIKNPISSHLTSSISQPININPNPSHGVTLDSTIDYSLTLSTELIFKSSWDTKTSTILALPSLDATMRKVSPFCIIEIYIIIKR